MKLKLTLVCFTMISKTFLRNSVNICRVRVLVGEGGKGSYFGLNGLFDLS